MKFFRALPILFLGFMSLTGCVKVCKTDCCTVRAGIVPPCCGNCNGRRPQVMTTYYPYAIDFDTAACSDGTCGECYQCLHGDEECETCCYCRYDEKACGSCNQQDCVCKPEYWDDISDRRGGVYVPHVTNYLVSPGDILEISVYGQEDTALAAVPVAPDGKLYYLFLDGFEVAGLTLDEIKAELEDKLKGLFLEPKVVISPREMAKQTYSILGRVRSPGAYPLITATTVRQALAAAGGFEEEGIGTRGTGPYGNFSLQFGKDFQNTLVNLQESFLVRDGKRLPVDFERLVRSSETEDDYYLKPGDYIYIAAFEYKEVYVLGAVASRMLPYRGGMTLVEALGSLPGLTFPTPYTGDYSQILVIRGNLKCPCVMRVDYKMILEGLARDLYLQPGDIVYIPNKKFRFGRELVRLAVNTFINVFTYNVTNQIIDDSSVF